MKTINLKDFYSSLYSHDCFYEVPDEVAELLELFKRRDESRRRKIYRNKAFYSLDCDDGIEKGSEILVPSAEETYLRNAEHEILYNAVRNLTDKQFRRLYAYFFMDISYTMIARLENVDESSVRKSINSALKHLFKIIKIFEK